MAYKWDDSLATGYLAIDNQHIQLFTILDRLIDASGQGRGDEIIVNVLKYLTAYTITHFTMEEDLMIKYEYEVYPGHKKLHDDFKLKVNELNKRISDAGPTKEVIKLTADTIGEWLVNHIKCADHLLADYIKSKDAENH
jgi:hemerythrin